MATINQIEANRRDALKSTGPKTPDGKAAVSMNSLRHGLRARTVVLPGEDRLEFRQPCDDLEAEWQPQSGTERFYLEQAAVSQWKLTRMEVGEASILQQTVSAKNQIPLLNLNAALSAPMPERSVNSRVSKPLDAIRSASPRRRGPRPLLSRLEAGPPRIPSNFRLSKRLAGQPHEACQTPP